jgi:hypothetical protein
VSNSLNARYFHINCLLVYVILAYTFLFFHKIELSTSHTVSSSQIPSIRLSSPPLSSLLLFVSALSSYSFLLLYSLLFSFSPRSIFTSSIYTKINCVFSLEQRERTRNCDSKFRFAPLEHAREETVRTVGRNRDPTWYRTFVFSALLAQLSSARCAS